MSQIRAIPATKSFWKARLRAIWSILTEPWFVVIHAGGDPLKAGLHYNVNREAMAILVAHVLPAHEDVERQAELVQQAKDILS